MKDNEAIELIRKWDKAFKSLGGRCRGELTKIISADPKIELLKKKAEVYANKPSPVLLLGETGTGKELFARALHGERSGKFVDVNITNLPETLLESELFGHMRGSFTGAECDRSGLLEYAADGTAFLDEIGNAPLWLQAKLLRTIESKTVRPVGSNIQRPISCRFIAATNRNLELMISRGEFMLDLYWRLAVYVLTIPPLRERKGDIREFLDAVADVEGELSEEDRDTLEQKELLGNYRELSALVLRIKAEKELT